MILDAPYSPKKWYLFFFSYCIVFIAVLLSMEQWQLLGRLREATGGQVLPGTIESAMFQLTRKI